MITKLLRQYGEHGNDYSIVEIGDTLNDVIDFLMKKELDKKTVVEQATNGEATNVSEFKSLEQPKDDLTGKDKFPARSPSTQDRVYLIEKGKKRWIRNPETLNKLGYNFHNVINIPNEEMDKYEVGEDIDLKEQKLEVQKPKSEVDVYGF